METSFIKKLISTIATDNKKCESITDESLVDIHLKSGPKCAFEEIVNRYSNKIYGFALRITKNDKDAEEVFQDVFMTLAQKLDTFRGESKFSSWLYRITANSSYMLLRSEKKHDNNLSLENYAPYDEQGTLMGKIMYKDWSSRPDIIIFNKESIEIIERAVNELPESYRTVFHLRDIEGLSNEEVASALELSVPAVKSRLHRARLFLRDKLSDYFYEWRK